MDPIGQSVLSYLEFFNCCYGIQDICHNTMDLIGQLLQVTKQNLQVTKQNLQVNKLLIYLLLTNQITGN